MRLSQPTLALIRSIPLLAIVAAGAGCDADELPPLGQVLLFVDTDAPLPPGVGQLAGPDEPPALFDTVRIDVLPPEGSCAQCSQELSVDVGRIGVGASLGILPQPGTAAYRARVRLFRAALLLEGEPRPDSTIDLTFALPEVAEGTIEEVTAFLPTEAVGQPLGQQEPLQPQQGRPTAPRVGTWPGAKRIPCISAPADDEVCVPGGAFWMGNPFLSTVTLPPTADKQRLVVVSPFFVEKTEVTVGKLRASGVASGIDPARYTESESDPYGIWCTYTDAPVGREELPITCLSWLKAREYCTSRGRDLLTEAQFEYVAGATRSLDFVWGHDFPSCADAVFGRAGYGPLELIIAPCKAPVGPGGPLPSGSGARDALTLPTGTVLDLAGNVSEYTLDVWNTQDEACWRPHVLHDPLCAQPGAQAGRTERGGNWPSARETLMAARRLPIEEWIASPYTGFRCARPHD